DERAGAAEDRGGDLVCGAVAGVEDHMHRRERARRHAADEEVLVLADQLDVGHERERRHGHVVAAQRAQLVLDLFLDRVGELHPVVAEDLHAVVIERVVRRGDRDPRGGVGRLAKVGDRGPISAVTGTVTCTLSGSTMRTSDESETGATFCTNVSVRPVMIMRSVATSLIFWMSDDGPETRARSGTRAGSPAW